MVAYARACKHAGPIQLAFRPPCQGESDARSAWHCVDYRGKAGPDMQASQLLYRSTCICQHWKVEQGLYSRNTYIITKLNVRQQNRMKLRCFAGMHKVDLIAAGPAGGHGRRVHAGPGGGAAAGRQREAPVPGRAATEGVLSPSAPAARHERLLRRWQGESVPRTAVQARQINSH